MLHLYRIFAMALAALAATILSSCQSPLGEVDPASRAAWGRYLRTSPYSLPNQDSSAGTCAARAAEIRSIANETPHRMLASHMIEAAETYEDMPVFFARAKAAREARYEAMGIAPRVGRRVGGWAADDDFLSQATGQGLGWLLGAALREDSAASAFTEVMAPWIRRRNGVFFQESWLNGCLGIPNSYYLGENLARITPRQSPSTPPVRVNFGGGYGYGSGGFMIR